MAFPEMPILPAPNFDLVIISNRKDFTTIAKTTNICLGDHFEKFINTQLSEGRYGSATEIVREGLRLDFDDSSHVHEK